VITGNHCHISQVAHLSIWSCRFLFCQTSQIVSDFASHLVDAESSRDAVVCEHLYGAAVMCEGASTNWKMFADVKAQNLGQEKAEYFTSKGTVVFMKKENCMYAVSVTCCWSVTLSFNTTLHSPEKNDLFCFAYNAVKREPVSVIFTRTTPLLLCCQFTSSSFALYYFFPFSFLIHFAYFLLLSIRSLSTRIVPLRFQARGRRRRPNLGLVCFFFVYDCVICIA